MNLKTNARHAEKVAEWENLNLKNLSQEQRVQLFAKAIAAIEQRSLRTLSNVTLLVIIDRAFHEAKEKFPVLEEVKAEITGVNFQGLLTKSKQQKTPELTDALRFLLIAILRVTGNITGDILTGPLHSELMTVTADKHVLRSVASSSADGDQQ